MANSVVLSEKQNNENKKIIFATKATLFATHSEKPVANHNGNYVVTAYYFVSADPDDSEMDMPGITSTYEKAIEIAMDVAKKYQNNQNKEIREYRGKEESDCQNEFKIVTVSDDCIVVCCMDEP